MPALKKCVLCSCGLVELLAAAVETLEGKRDPKERVLRSFSHEEWCCTHINPENTRLYKELWMWGPERLVSTAGFA